MDTTDSTIELPASELRDLAVVAGRFVEPDERVAAGNVWLTAHGGHRVWRVSTQAVAIELRGEHDPGHYDVLVPTRLLNGARLVAGGTDTVTLATGRHCGRPAAELRGHGAVVTVTTHQCAVPARPRPLADDETAATAHVEVATLREALALAMQVPYGFDSERTPWPLMRWSISDGVLEIAVDWPTFGAALHVVPATTAGSGEAMIMPGALAALLDAYRDEEILLKLPKLPCESVELSRDGWTGSVPQTDPEGDWPAHAEQVILEAFGEEAADGDHGSYPLATEPDVSGRFSAEPPWRLEVSTIVLADVEPSADLLSELNDHNRHLGLARVAWHRDSIVMQADLLIDSLDAGELRTTVGWLRHHTTRLTPVLAAVFGGTDPNRRPQESR